MNSRNYTATIPPTLAEKLKEKGMPIKIELEWYPNGMAKAEKECKQVLIDKACEWLEEQLYTDDGGCLVSDWYQKINEFLAAFREAMD